MLVHGGSNQVSKSRGTLGTVLRLAVASLVVGLVLAALGWTPADLLDRMGGMLRGLWQLSSDALGWAGSYMLLGAMIVLPIWLARLLWKRLQQRRD